MSSFAPGGPEIPQAPLEIPTPDIPAANFQSIGASMEAGKRGVGIALDWYDFLGKWILDLFTKCLGILLGSVEFIVGFLIRLLVKVRERGAFGTNELIAATVADLFGSSVPPAFGSVGYTDAQNKAYANTVSRKLMDSLLGTAATGGQGALTPSDTRAVEYITDILSLAINGWAMGAIVEIPSAGQIKTFTELTDIVAQTMGLGRMVRRVLAAPLKILVEDPYTWKLHDQYRPKLLSEEQAVRQYLRGLMDRKELDRVLGWQGYSAAVIEAAINYNRAHLSASELETLALHGTMTEDDAKKRLNAQGYDDFTAAGALEAIRAKRVDAWHLELIREAQSAYVARKIDRQSMQGFIDNSGLPEAERTIIGLVTDLKYSVNRTRFSIAEGAKLVEQGLWNLDQFRELVTYHGYTSGDETDLELMVLGKIKSVSDAQAQKAAALKAKQEAAAARLKAAADKAAAVKAAAEAKGISLGKYEILVKDGARSISDYRTYLVAKGVASDNRDALIVALQAAMEAAAQAKAQKAAAAGTPRPHKLDVAQLEKSVKAGNISMLEYQTRLKQDGYQDEDIQLLAELLKEEIDSAKLKADTKTAAKAALAVKHVDLTQEERAVRLGLKTIDDFTAFLDSHGFDQADAAILAAELQAQLDADKFAAAKKAEVAAKLADKGLNLAQLERAVRAGVNSVADYQAALASAGYDTEAQASLVSLLQLQMQTDQQTLDLSGRAAALLGQRGTSIADLERAVKLGVVPMQVYGDALSAAGLADSEVQLLVLTLAAAIAKGKKAAPKPASVSAKLKASGVTLASLESAVRNGTLSLPQFEASLSQAGVAAADIASLSGLLAEELANKEHLKQLQLTAAQRAAARGLTLGEEQAAVKAGVKSLDDYRTFLDDLGFALGDVETLVATLAAQTAPKVKPPAKKQPVTPGVTGG